MYRQLQLFYFLFIFIVTSNIASAKEYEHFIVTGTPVTDVQAATSEAAKAYYAKNYDQAIILSDNILATINDYSLALQIKGFAYMDSGRYEKARQYLNWAFWTNPFERYNLLGLAYLEILQNNNLTAAKHWLEKAIRLTEKDLTDLREDTLSYGKKNKPKLFNQLYEYGRQQLNIDQSKRLAATGMKIGSAFDKLNSGDVSAGASSLKQVLNKLKKLPKPPHEGIVHLQVFFAEQIYYAGGDPQTVIDLLEKSTQYATDHNASNPYNAVKSAWLLGNLYNNAHEAKKALLATNTSIQLIDQQPYDFLNCNLLQSRLLAYGTINNNKGPGQRKNELSDARLLLKLGQNMASNGYSCVANANNSIGSIYLVSNNKLDRKNALSYLKKAIQAAQKSDDQYLVNAIRGNLAIAYFQQGKKKEALQVSEASAQQSIKAKRFSEAGLIYNNLGAMMLMQKDLSGAALVLEKAVNFAEQNRRKVPPEQRRDFMNQEVSAYQFLAAVYAQQNQPQKLYDIIENSRARVLAEVLSNNKTLKRGDIKWLQKNLRSDEAALLYSLFETQQNASLALSIVTREGVKALFIDKKNFSKKLRKRFAKAYGLALRTAQDMQQSFNPFEAEVTNEMSNFVSLIRKLMEGRTGLDPKIETGMLNDLLKSFYELLIEPGQKYLKGKKHLLLSPDSVLSFIPFDALIDNSGHYLAENYNIHYTPSVTVYRQIHERNYPASRSTMLAFGDARYQPYTVNTKPASTRDAFGILESEVEDNFKHNRSQRSSFAKLGVTGKSWKYLPGTLKEVKKISQRIKGVTALFNKDFTEKRIKKMSASGELANYKVLHLATHGMVVSSIPELSSVITTIQKEANSGEDGYLTAAEVSKLKLKADFVALSACQTGLGKIYAGEGVVGLNSAFLSAGANATSVSLWSISDDATQRFMVGLYDLVYNQNQSHVNAMAEMKRRFIRGDCGDGCQYGDTYRAPKFWAPFAYYGE